MINRTFIYLFILLILVSLFSMQTSLVLASLNTDYIKIEITYTPPPPSEYDVWGWAWSNNIGWVSFSCSDRNYCATSNYGVKIDSATEEMFGYAWSDHVGWISFNSGDLAGCPVSPCKASVDLETGYVSGWAKALIDGDGWSGWLRLGNSNYRVWIDEELDPSEFKNYSWSDLNLGWLSFNCVNQGVCATSNYKVLTDLDFTPTVPVPTVFNLFDSFTAPCSQSRLPTLSWNTDANLPYDYQVQIDNNSSFGSPEVSGTVNSTNSTSWSPACSYCCVVSPYNNILFGENTYYWRVRARNFGGEWGDWSITDTFLTKLHCYPYPDFLCNNAGCSLLSAVVGDTVVLEDSSTVYDGQSGATSCAWDLPDGASVVSGNPAVSCEIRVIFAPGVNQEVSMTATDSTGYACLVSKTLNISLPSPEWKEIRPF